MYSIDVDIFSIQYVYNIQLARLFEGHWAACGIVYFVNKKRKAFYPFNPHCHVILPK